MELQLVQMEEEVFAFAYAADDLNRVGWNLHAAFNWSASLPYRNYSNDPSPGSEAMAMYGFRMSAKQIRLCNGVMFSINGKTIRV